MSTTCDDYVAEGITITIWNGSAHIPSAKTGVSMTKPTSLTVGGVGLAPNRANELNQVLSERRDAERRWEKNIMILRRGA